MELRQAVPAGVYKPSVERLSTSAFDRSSQFLANEPLSDIAHIRSYYALVKQLQAILQTEMFFEDLRSQQSGQLQKIFDSLSETSRYLTQNQDKLGPQPKLHDEINRQTSRIQNGLDSASQAASTGSQTFVRMQTEQVELCANESTLARNDLGRIYQRWFSRKKLLRVAIISLPFILVIFLPGTSRTQDLMWIKFKRSLRRFRHHPPGDVGELT